MDRSTQFGAAGKAQATASVFTNSSALQICGGILDRVKMLPIFRSAGFKYKSTPALPIQPEDIPLCGVYFLKEDMGPDGDANAGEPRFIHTVTTGFSVWIQNNDPEHIEDKLDRLFMSILQGLMTDYTLYYNDEWEIEGFQRGSRTHHFGTVGSNNEMPIAELRFDLAFNFRTYWPPIVTAELRTIHVDIEPDGMTDEVLDIGVRYDLPQD
jgi:hypothetical protein